MPNPTLDQITGNITLLKYGNSSVSERMRRSDRDSALFLQSGFRTKRFTFPLTGGVPLRLSKTRPDVRSPRYDLTIAIVPASTSTSRWPALVFEVISS